MSRYAEGKQFRAAEEYRKRTNGTHEFSAVKLSIGLSRKHLMEPVKAVEKKTMGGARKTLLLAVLLEFICTKSQGRNIHFINLTAFTINHLHDVNLFHDC